MTTLIRNRFIRSLGRGIKRRFSPKSFAFLRFIWYFATFYLPCQACFWIKGRKPLVHRFGGNNGTFDLAEQIRDVNLLAPTRTCRVMTWYGSDKGSFRHNYTMVYESLFKNIMNQPLRIFELGLGTNNEGVKSTMGTCGSPGASLRGWRELFPHALVFGADIDRCILFEEDRIKTFYCDQLDPVAIKELWARHELRNGVDIVIEDGLHTFEANVSFLQGSLDHVNPGGYYVIEDIHNNFAEQWFELLKTTYAKQYPTYEFVFASLPSSHKDNNLLIIHKPTTASS
jgi:hypothetical protein